MDNNVIDEEQVTIEWKQFGESFVSDLWQFFNSDEYSDVTISCEDGHEIKSHRILLAMVSTYFRDLFKRNKYPGHIVCLSTMSSDIVLKIFTLIYGGVVQIPPSSLSDFVKAAKFLKLNGFEEVDSNVDSHESTTNNKRTFSIRLNRVDVSDAAPELHVVDSDDETPNDSTASQPAASDVIMDEYNDKVTSTQIASDTKFFPSSDSSDESDENPTH